jgi:hypothetical protein
MKLHTGVYCVSVLLCMYIRIRYHISQERVQEYHVLIELSLLQKMRASKTVSPPQNLLLYSTPHSMYIYLIAHLFIRHKELVLIK